MLIPHRHLAVNHRVHGLFLLAVLCLTAAGLQACGPPPFADIRNGIGSRGHYIAGVPFFRQTAHDCGPAALASVYSYWKQSADLDRLTARVVLPKLGGALPMDMERAAREDGFRTATAHGDRTLLFSSLKRDTPVICLLDLGFGLYQQPHYVTVVGFDDQNRLFIMHDGVTRDRTMTYERFEEAWARAGMWMLVIVPEAPQQ
jgi:ABC-type bacteriocin/lantibiotic exporter with double-glycine peptidase domain